MKVSIAKIRLASQQLTSTEFNTPKDIVSWMGAMQAQDYNMVKWAIGIRLPGATDKSVEAAINSGEIIRTHLLRPTWHLATGEDIRWMLELTAPRIRSALRSWDKNLELNEKIYSKTNTIIYKAIKNNNHLLREEIAIKLNKAGIITDNFRTSHIMFRAELDGIVCSGALRGKKQTYALLDERVPNTATFNKEEALQKLALRYFTSHCPATLQDFMWWSGLSLTEARNALEMIQQNFIKETIDSQVYYMPASLPALKKRKDSIHLLPAFDEYLISYKDRKATISLENHSKAISKNGIFRPVIICDGQAIGIWKKTMKKDQVMIEKDFFSDANHSPVASQIKKAEVRINAFLSR